MMKKNKQKKWTLYKIVNIIILLILIILTCIFTTLFIFNQKTYIVAFLITILFLGVWVVGYFMGSFFYMNKDNILTGIKKIINNYQKK